MVALVVIISSIAVTYNQKTINKEMEKYLYELSIQSKGKIDTRIDSNMVVTTKSAKAGKIQVNLQFYIL